MSKPIELKASSKKDEFDFSLENLFFKVPIHKEYLIDADSAGNIFNIINTNETFDAFCKECNENSVFRIYKYRGYAPYYSGQWGNVPGTPDLKLKMYFEQILNNSAFSVEMQCSRNQNHILLVNLVIQDSKIMKVGQYPSLYDEYIPELKGYEKITTKENIEEFKKALLLNTHGYGAASFVYLRRIFERLVEKMHEKESKKDGWNEETYRNARMSDKIEILSDSLPESLVESSTAFNILSIGIHALSDKECGEYFDGLRSAIKLILDDKVKQFKEEKNRADVKKLLLKSKSELKKLK